MTPTVLIILACIVADLAAMIGVGVHALRHGARQVWDWLLLPAGALLTLAFIPASIGHAEGYWTTRSPGLWLTIALGAAGAAMQVFGWRAVLRPRLRPTECPQCGYERAALARCPECGAGRDEVSPPG